MSNRRFTPTPEQKAKAKANRDALIARSVPIQIARKSGILPWAELENVNACLRLMYQNETGQTEWNTFKGWRDAGRAVRKGEKGFAVWGKPLRAEGAENDTQAGGDDVSQFTEADAQEAARGFRFFPIAYIFHAGQVDGAPSGPPRENYQPGDLAAFVESALMESEASR